MRTMELDPMWTGPTQATCVEIPGEEMVVWNVTFSNGEVKRFRLPLRPVAKDVIEGVTP